MRIGRRRGLVRMRLDRVEVTLLGQLLDELDGVVDPDVPAEADPVRARLFPAGYRDDGRPGSASIEFRELTESSLRELKLDRSGQCRAELAAATEPAGTAADLSLDADAATRWLTVLNDLRLTLGTRLDVREDDDHHVDPDDPDAQPWLAYYWLTAVQDRLVTELDRS